MASKPPAYPNFTITRRKLKDDYLEQAGAEYGTWLESLLGEALPAPGAADLLESLKGGDALCRVVNRIMQDHAPPGAHVVKWKPPTTPFIAVENIRGFLKACTKIGLKDNALFEVNDLVNRQNGNKVVQTLGHLKKLTETSESKTPTSQAPSPQESHPSNIPEKEEPKQEPDAKSAPEPVKEEADAIADAIPEPEPEPVKQPEPEPAKPADPAPVKQPEPVPKKEPEPVKKPEPVPEPVKKPEHSKIATTNPAPAKTAPQEPEKSANQPSEVRLRSFAGRMQNSASLPRESIYDSWGIIKVVKDRMSAEIVDQSLGSPSDEETPVSDEEEDDTMVVHDDTKSKPLIKSEVKSVPKNEAPPIPPRPERMSAIDIMEAQNEPGFEATSFDEAIRPGSKVRSLYKFVQRTSDELTFVENQTIVIAKASPTSEWWLGEIGSHTGWFPACYVEVLTSSSKRIWTQKYQNSTPGGTLERTNSQADKLQALMEMNQRSATLPARFRRPALDSEPSQPAAPVAARTEPSPPPPAVAPQAEKISPPHSAPTPAQEAAMQKRPSSKSSLAAKISGIPVGMAQEAERWKDKVSPEVYESISEKERQRQEVIFELTRTEREYVRDLGIIIDVFLTPIQAKKILTDKEIVTIFSGISQLKPLNEELLSLLTKRFEANPVVEEVGDIFISMAEYFKMYKVYCKNHTYALMEHQNIKASGKNKKLKQFEEECFKRPECRMMDLQSFLLKPVQRICKYPLLIKEILKFTEADHKDREKLDKAFLNIQAIVQVVNEATKEEANMRRILEIQKHVDKLEIMTTGRKILLEDTVIIPDADSKKKEDNVRNLYLFNDLFLLTKFVDKEKVRSEIAAKHSVHGLITTLPESDPLTVIIQQRPKSGASLLSLKETFRFPAQFKDMEAKNRFLHAWQVAQKSKGEVSLHSPDFFKLENTDTTLRKEESQKELLKSGSIREVDFPREEQPLPENVGEVLWMNTVEIVTQANKQAYRQYKSAQHLLLVVKVTREHQFEHEVYKSFDDITNLHLELKKLPDLTLPKLPHLSSSLISEAVALGKVEEVGKYLQDLVSVVSDGETSKALLRDFCAGDTLPGLRESFSTQKDKKTSKSLSFENMLAMDDTVRLSLSKEGSVESMDEVADESDEKHK